MISTKKTITNLNIQLRQFITLECKIEKRSKFCFSIFGWNLINLEQTLLLYVKEKIKLIACVARQGVAE
jgi:hypothetical protein